MKAIIFYASKQNSGIQISRKDNRYPQNLTSEFCSMHYKPHQDTSTEDTSLLFNLKQSYLIFKDTLPHTTPVSQI
jgi:hypothetical protein